MSAALFIFEVHALSGFPNSQVSASGSTATQRDGSHDFDFLIGDWKAHVRRLPERLKGSNVWVEYEGISNHKKLLDSNANFEEFDVSSPDNKLRIKAQTLRLYNPESHQWSIYLVDLDKGTLDLPPVVGQLNGKRGEFYRRHPTIQGYGQAGRIPGSPVLTIVLALGAVLARAAPSQLVIPVLNGLRGRGKSSAVCDQTIADEECNFR